MNLFIILFLHILLAKCGTPVPRLGRLVYKKLGDNYGKINSTMIGSIIKKVY